MLKYVADDTMNCLQCCIAGIFDMKMEHVPGVHKWSKESDYWFKGFYAWSTMVLGYTPIAVVDDTLDDIFHIAVTREGDAGAHAVIARGTEVVWDPNPNQKEKIVNLLDAAEWEYSLVFIKSKGKTRSNLRNYFFILCFQPTTGTIMFKRFKSNVKSKRRGIT